MVEPMKAGGDMDEQEEAEAAADKTGSLKESSGVCHKDRFTQNSDGWTVVKEGQAEVLFPSLNDVFYNPVQEFNRDLSTAVIQAHAMQQLEGVECVAGEVCNEGISVLEALAASGLRSIRFAKEIRGLKSVVANDWSKQATESIRRNVSHNKVEQLVTPHNGDASLLMYQHKQPKERFHVIDLDPYGSPTPFLDSAVQAVSDGGLLCVTATDMAVLCGNSPETCYTKYGAIALKTRSCHEFAVRILLQCLESHANRYGRYIEPLLSLSIDFYCRVFVRVQTGQAVCKQSTSKLGQVYQCTGCESLALQPLGRLTTHKQGGGHIKYCLPSGPPVDRHCAHCGNSHHIGGPIWLAPIHNLPFVTDLLESLSEDQFQTYPRMVGMLSMVLEELQDIPLYYELARLCNITKQSQGKLTIYLSALLNAGYRVSLTHANKHGIKTDAPNTFIWSMMRAWAKKEGRVKSNLSEGSPGRIIMDKREDADDSVCFDEHPLANPESRKNSLKRFQMNPERNWGPKMRSKTSTLKNMQNSKKLKNQGKYSKKKLSEDGDLRAKKLRTDSESI
eukprot:GFUD01029921.1.p1 GENE.GFUD01029921.1~~GFUD01029921.1.p1  ORF type:complete len:578 (+),score=169.81 GFUD01029921.1:53-1735(+)